MAGAHCLACRASGPYPLPSTERDAAGTAAGVLRRPGTHCRRTRAGSGRCRQAAGLACEGFTVALHPWEAILDQAKQQGCDLIVMASHGRRGVAALLLGSETSRVLTHSPLPVLIVK
ncbi:universal stress protein [Aquabacterium sp.]|uniref:universal stress protein n=1 Tax=Aquabacterium sp. TaxID=1872578 RepID=UPI003784CB09